MQEDWQVGDYFMYVGCLYCINSVKNNIFPFQKMECLCCNTNKILYFDGNHLNYIKMLSKEDAMLKLLEM